MKMVMVHVLVALLPYWMPGNPANACEGKCRKAKCAKAVMVDDQTAPTGTGAAVDTGVRRVMVVGDPVKATADGRAAQHVVRVEVKGDEGPGKGERVWLGVSLGSVPSALSAQLGEEVRGILVENVVEGSPADKAGVQVHDIVVSFEGEEIGEDPGALSTLLHRHKPGEVVSMKVIRAGQPEKLSVTLGARSEGGVAHWSWKAEGEPDAQVEDEVRTRGKFLFKAPDGQWTFKDLGELEHLKELKDLPAKIRMMIPKHGTQSTKTFIEGGQKRVITKVEDDGHSITIKQENEDEITVTRTDERGKEATATYDSEEALKDGDAEAYAMLENAGDVQVFGVDGDGPGFLHLDLDVDVDADDLGEHVQEWREKMEKGLWEARETYEKAVEEMQRLREEWHNGKGIQAFHDLHDQLAPTVTGLGFTGKPKHSFEVRTDGTIEVRIRKGDSELVRLYSNEAELKARDPKLAKKYAELTKAGD
ncbi:MAG: PDZ domain-containing protein [Planctomycetota bacterium]